MKKSVNTYGIEIEKAVADIKTGKSHKTSQDFFIKLKSKAQERETPSHFHTSDIQPDVIVGTLSDDLGEQSIDNGFNLLESAITYKYSLKELDEKINLDLKTTVDALKDEDAVVLNSAVHPFGKTDQKTYKEMVAPKGVYDFLRYRGWDHSAGIDAKAQNSPSTGVTADTAADALSVVVGASAAFVALFANSPISEGKITGYKESRLRIWDRMMKNSRVHGDYVTAQFPPIRFKTLAQYFQWMFGTGTGILFVVNATQANYKTSGSSMVIVNENPPVLEYLSAETVEAIPFSEISKKNAKSITLKPHISHMEIMQFAQFSPARIRYGLKHDDFPVTEFVEACKKPGEKRVEKLFDKHAHFMYIEGRDAGANFADAELMKADENAAKTATISPSALQAGLIQNMKKTAEYIDSIPWNTLKSLRDAAIKDGLQGSSNGVTVSEFTTNILALAKEGLSKSDKQYLAYPEYVLKTGKNGADRTLEFFKKNSKMSRAELMREYTLTRQIII